MVRFLTIGVAPGSSLMATNIFLLLNLLGVIFLLYVLVNFWNEGRATKSSAGTMRPRRNTNDVVIVAHRVSRPGQSGLSVISFQDRKLSLRGVREFRWLADEPDGVQAKTSQTESSKRTGTGEV